VLSVFSVALYTPTPTHHRQPTRTALDTAMPVRLIITINAAPGKGAEFAEAFKGRCQEVMAEPGCLQFEVFRSALDPDKLTLLELWEDDAALEAHGKLNAARAPLPAGLRGAGGAREDYAYNKTR
jgi:quinol monooxygenase YgiN